MSKVIEFPSSRERVIARAAKDKLTAKDTEKFNHYVQTVLEQGGQEPIL